LTAKLNLCFSLRARDNKETRIKIAPQAIKRNNANFHNFSS